MIPQLVLVCLLFSSSSGDILKSPSGQHPDEQVTEESPLSYETFLPVWADAVKHLAADEDRVKTIFRFFNRPNYYRYVLDIILIIGNLDIPDEGFAPYSKKGDAIAALRPIIEEMKGFTESPVDEEFIEEEIEPFTEYRRVKSMDGGQKDLPLEEFGTETSDSVTYGSIEAREEISDGVGRESPSSGEDDEVVERFPKDAGEFEHRDGWSSDRISNALSLDEDFEEDSQEFKHRTGLPLDDDRFWPDDYSVPSAIDDDFEYDEHYPREQADQPSEPLQAGSISGIIPGVHFPDYDDIPITSFNCADKDYIPGFYADLETGCQVFHVCWPQRRESFLCPIGTTFNQAILSCDYWYITNCSLSQLYFDVNAPDHETSTTDGEDFEYSEKPIIATPIPTSGDVQTEYSMKPQIPQRGIHWNPKLEFLPVKYKVVEYNKTGSNEHQKSQYLVQMKNLKLEGKITEKAIAAQIVEMVLAAERRAQNAKLLVPQQTSAGYLPLKSIRGTEGKQVQPSLPEIVQKFVVKPVSAKRPSVQISKQARVGETVPDSEDLVPEESGPIKVYKILTVSHPNGDEIPEIVMSALEMAGGVLENDILPFTRQALMKNYVKHAKLKELY